MAWRLALSLEKLRSQINAAFPARSKASDGSIGDQAHASRASDHNPNAQGVVTAIDITHDPEHGVDGEVLSRALAQDKRTKYVIFAGEIYRTYKPNLGWAKYTGPNSHHHHVHISVKQESADDESPWVLSGKPARRTLKFGDSGPDVSDLQTKLSIKADGKFGNHTLFAVREYQLANGLKGDGIVGPKTLALLYD